MTDPAFDLNEFLVEQTQAQTTPMVDPYEGASTDIDSYIPPDIPSYLRNKRYQRVLLLDGVETTFYTVSALAEALGRSPATIRGWENKGIIPASPFRSGSDSPKGERRLYTEDVIEAVRVLADSLGMIEHKTLPIPDEFTPGVVAIFESVLD